MERLSPLPWQQASWRQLLAWRARLPHALLLYGTRGIGKRQLAGAFAQMLLCEAPGRDAACGACASCRLIAADNHPDLRWLMPEADMPARQDEDAADEAGDDAPPSGRTKKGPSLEILIDQVRRIGDFLAVSSHRGGVRIVLLAPAEALNASAANALLKTLEEPPAGALFIAVSDELDAVSPTIRSRCVLVRVPAPSHDDALRWLQQQGVDDAEARLAEAGGAPLAVVADENADPRRRLEADVRAVLLKVLTRGPAASAADIVAAVPRDVAVGPAIRLCQRWGWDLLAEHAAQRVRYYPDHKRTLATLARAVDPVRLSSWLKALAESQAVSDHPLNARLAVEQALLGYLGAWSPAR
jgi:DNA polymerase-3 subunit delta'